jgi:hypothetical protein
MYLILRGKTFGITHSSYEKTYQPYSLGRTVKYDALYTPGPGKYHYLKEIGEDKNKISMSARLNTPDSNYYKVSPN